MKSRKRRLFLIVLSMMLLLGAQSVLAETVWTYPVNISTQPSGLKAKAKTSEIIVSWKKIPKKKKDLLNKIEAVQVQFTQDPSFANGGPDGKPTSVYNSVYSAILPKTKTKATLKNIGFKGKWYVRARYVGKANYETCELPGSMWSKIKAVKVKKVHPWAPGY